MTLSLQTRIDNLYIPETTLTLDEFNILIKDCVEAKESAATVFVYDKMKEIGLNPTSLTYLEIDKLHSKKLKDNN